MKLISIKEFKTLFSERFYSAGNSRIATGYLYSKVRVTYVTPLYPHSICVWWISLRVKIYQMSFMTECWVGFGFPQSYS